MTIAFAADQLAELCTALAADGHATVADFLPPSAIRALAECARRREADGAFHAAGVGRGAALLQQTGVRGDRILWLEERTPAPAEVVFWRAIEALRLALNGTLYLGLFDFEGHYAMYPPGTRYCRHRDRFRDDDARTLSCALYLNDDWSAADGGALRIHVDAENSRDVLPAGGTFVCFLSERFEHEVLPAARERLSLTGWFRRRA
jgi:SM-20-related protein